MFSAIRKNLPEYLKAGAVIVDVRSPMEFQTGHVEGSINIPIQEFSNRYNELDPEKIIILCCVSGNRSGMATSFLKSHGFKNVFNGGPWNNLAQ